MTDVETVGQGSSSSLTIRIVQRTHAAPRFVIEGLLGTMFRWHCTER